jgi:hypothetical protein
MHTRIPLLLFLTLLSGCLAPPRSDVEAILHADSERIDAMLSADPARLEVSLHESLTYTHSTGAVDTRASLIESLVAGTVDYRSIERLEPAARIQQGSGFVTSATRMVVAVGNETFTVNGVYTAVYQCESGRWQLVAYHSSPRNR